MNARKKQSQDTNSTSLLKGRGTAEVWKRVTVFEMEVYVSSSWAAVEACAVGCWNGSLNVVCTETGTLFDFKVLKYIYAYIDLLLFQR